MVKVFKFKHRIGDEYWKVLEYIDDNGKIYVSERGQKYKEAEPILIEVFDPMVARPNDILPQYFVQRWGEEFIWKYALNVAEGKSEDGEWAYSYGERIAYGGQLNNVIKKLKTNPHTRQAMCGIYRPEDTNSDTPPCMCIVDFKIRDGKLHTYAVFRSNDMENAYPANYFELLLLGVRVAEEVGVELGKIITFSISAHIYVR